MVSMNYEGWMAILSAIIREERDQVTLLVNIGHMTTMVSTKYVGLITILYYIIKLLKRTH